MKIIMFLFFLNDHRKYVRVTSIITQPVSYDDENLEVDHPNVVCSAIIPSNRLYTGHSQSQMYKT